MSAVERICRRVRMRRRERGGTPAVHVHAYRHVCVQHALISLPCAL